VDGSVPALSSQTTDSCTVYILSAVLLFCWTWCCDKGNINSVEMSGTIITFIISVHVFCSVKIYET